MRAMTLRRAWVGRGLMRAGPGGRVGWPVVLLALAVGAAAVGAVREYRADYRARWADVYHDRNAHYQAGLGVACELRQGHLYRAVRDLDAGSNVWPLLHPVLLAGVLVVAGPSPLWAVLPSLAGWCLAAVSAFLLARRLGGPFGWAGGLLAAAFFLGSPALQGLGTDVMLESLGLGLTAASLCAYLAFAEQPTRRRGVVFGAVLSCLFLHKFNYWVLVVLGLAATEVLRRPAELLGLLRAAVRGRDWGRWAGSQFARPLNYLIVGLVAASVAVVLNAGRTVEVAGRTVVVGTPRLFVHAAFALVVLRVALWWRGGGRDAASRRAGPSGVSFLTWAVVPPLLWLLVPFRFGTFLWFSSPANTAPGMGHTFADGLRYYAGGFARHYHVAPELAWVTGVLAAAGLVALLVRRGGPPGRLAVPVFVALSGALAVLHPNHQLRFLHTWAPLAWVLAGVGFAACLGAASRVAGRTAAGVIGVAVSAALGVALVQLTPEFGRVGPEFNSGYQPGVPSVRDLYDAYLPHVRGDEPTAVFTNLPDASWRWPYLERFGHKNGFRDRMKEVGVYDPVTAAGAERWVAATDARTVVYIDVPPASPFFAAVYSKDNSAILDVMTRQTTFALAHREAVGGLGVVYVWRR